MSMRKSLLLLLAVLAVAGCTSSPPKVDINNGVIIEKFTADPTDVFDFQTVTFSTDVSNVGGTTAEDVRLKLLGVENAWRQQSGSGTVTEVSRGPITLKPPNLKDNIAGDSRFFDFTLTAPDLNEGDRASFPVKARVEFAYATTGSIIVKAMNANQHQILQRRGETVSDPVAESNSDSPVKFSFVRGAAPLVIDPDEGATIERDFRFEVTNVGSGWPITDNSVGKVGGSSRGSKITLQAPSGITIKSCDGITGTQDSFSVVLRSDGKAPISCTLNINTADWTTRSEGNIVFKVELNYRYFVDSEVSISVQGTKRGDVSRPGPAPSASPLPGASPTSSPGATPIITASLAITTSQAELPWYKGDFFVKFTFNDPSGLSNRKCQYVTHGKSDWQTVSCSGITDSRDIQVVVASDCPFDGNCIVRARVADANNNAVSSIAEKVFKIDRAAPVFTSEVLSDKTAIVTNQAVAYSATVTDATSGMKECRMVVDTDDQGTMTLSGTTTSKSYTRATAGAFTVKIRCEDNAGNAAEKSKSFTAVAPTPTPTPTATPSPTPTPTP